jgi:hypothetical protein
MTCRIAIPTRDGTNKFNFQNKTKQNKMITQQTIDFKYFLINY